MKGRPGEQLEKTVKLVLNRNEVLAFKFNDLEAEVRFLRAHLEGNHIMLKIAYDKTQPQMEASAEG